ncbi:MAG: hypothetical protein IIA07_04800 [Proteobacteria bacterium]|nr:hypothetical protein [Pseudomonadota bacterium]
MRQPLIAVCSLLLAVAGCVAPESLMPKSAQVPAGIDLSGLWQLHDDSMDTVRRIDDAELAAAGGSVPISTRSSSRDRKSNRASGTLVHVFLETGKSLKITQTTAGLFISFDRAIVEEYRFGENREISVGPVIADRVSGWEGRSYAIETLASDGAKLVESYRLDNGGQLLLRSILIRHKNEIQLSVEQVFDRIASNYR